MTLDTRDRAIRVVKAIGKSITDNAENIVSNYDYPCGLRIECRIDVDMVPTIEITNEITTKDIVDAIEGD